MKNQKIRKGNVNIRMIAKEAGVSIASVLIVLNGKEPHRVSPEVQKKILRVCEELKYYPNIHTVRMLNMDFHGFMNRQIVIR